MAREEQDPGLVSAAASVESGVEEAQALAEAAPGVGPVGRLRVGVYGTPSVLELARVLEARVRRARAEEPDQGATKEVGAAVVGAQGAGAAAAQEPGAVVPVADLVGRVQAREGSQAVGVRVFLENG
jgi:hypothetical protein